MFDASTSSPFIQQQSQCAASAKHHPEKKPHRVYLMHAHAKIHTQNYLWAYL